MNKVEIGDLVIAWDSKFQVNMFQELENEILFCRDGIIKQEIVPLEEVWKI